MKSKKSDRRLYECVLVTTTGEIDNIISSVLKSLQGSLVDPNDDVTSSCSILHRQSWAKRTFAYKIKGWKKGYYSAIYLNATPESLDSFSKSLRMNPDVLRFLIVLVKFIPTSLPKIALEEVDNNVVVGLGTNIDTTIAKEVTVDTNEENPESDFVISFKNPELLAQYMSETCKIIPAKYNSLLAYQQRISKREIKRARRLGILPYCQSKKK